MANKIWTKTEIKAKLVSIELKTKKLQPLSENEMTWLTRGLMAIYNGQTSQEKISMTTTEDNGIGFNGVDATILTSFAEQWRSRNWLSTKQFAILAKKMVKYAGQLEKIAAAKAQPKVDDRNCFVLEASEIEAKTDDGAVIFPNGAAIAISDMTPEFRNDELVAWTAKMDGVEYIVIND